MPQPSWLPLPDLILTGLSANSYKDVADRVNVLTDTANDLGSAAWVDVGISSGDVPQLGTGGTLPAVSGIYLTHLNATNIDTGLISPSVLDLATTPAIGDNSQAIATTAFVDTLISGVDSIDVHGNSNVTLFQNQYGKGLLIFTGTLTGNINIIFPVTGKWTVVNATTGSFTITCKTGSGSGVIVIQGASRIISGNGTNIAFSDLISASELTNGVTGTGAIVLANSPSLKFTHSSTGLTLGPLTGSARETYLQFTTNAGATILGNVTGQGGSDISILASSTGSPSLILGVNNTESLRVDGNTGSLLIGYTTSQIANTPLQINGPVSAAAANFSGTVSAQNIYSIRSAVNGVATGTWTTVLTAAQILATVTGTGGGAGTMYVSGNHNQNTSGNDCVVSFNGNNAANTFLSRQGATANFQFRIDGSGNLQVNQTINPSINVGVSCLVINGNGIT